MRKEINHSQLTAKERTKLSFPSQWLLNNNKLHGDILDFGCGFGFDTLDLQNKGFQIDGYDKFHKPEYPTKKYDTIICNYVLNVLQPDEQPEVLMAISELLKSNGKAYFTVRRDLTYEGFRTHKIHKETTYQCNVILPYKSILLNENCEIYEYQHFNKIKRKNDECCFCSIDDDRLIVSEIATSVAFYDKFPVSKGHILIIPKRHVSNYFELTIHEQRAIWLLVNRCKSILQKEFNPDGYNVGININEPAGQTVGHCHIHLIPRYLSDVENPRGGVRGVIPSKKDY
jgi:diadenosine tetraphosphate (Ap4A) HIT family hydrolase